MAKTIKKDGTTVSTKSVYETGHGKNAANFSKLVISVQGMGDKYQPSNDLINIKYLIAQDARVETCMENWAHTERESANAEIARNVVFGELKPFSTRLLATLASSAGVDKRTLADADSINKKIQGARIGKKPEVDPTLPKELQKRNISASQQSFDLKAEHFRKFRTLLASVPGYKPNEEDLTLEAVGKFESRLNQTNETAATINDQLVNAKNARNAEIYNDENGLVAVSKLVKTYLKGKGTSHPEFLKVRSLSFRKLSDKGLALE